MSLTATEIRVELIRRGVSLMALSRKHSGATQPALSHVVAGTKRTPWLRRIIAEAIERPYEEVWGEPDPKIDRLVSWAPMRAAYPYRTAKPARRASQGAA